MAEISCVIHKTKKRHVSKSAVFDKHLVGTIEFTKYCIHDKHDKQTK